jgi:hypothetical protein
VHGLGEGVMLCPDWLVRLGIASRHGALMAATTRRERLSRAGGSHHRAQSGGPGHRDGDWRLESDIVTWAEITPVALGPEQGRHTELGNLGEEGAFQVHLRERERGRARLLGSRLSGWRFGSRVSGPLRRIDFENSNNNFQST